MDSLYDAGFTVWNTLINIALTLFTTSPSSAGGGSLYSVAHGVFSSLASISIPIATIFFLVAICRDVIMTPPDQQIRTFLGDALKFGVMIGILANLWEIMGVIIQVSDGITTSAVGSPASFTMSMSTDLQNCITQAQTLPTTPVRTNENIFEWIGVMIQWFFTEFVAGFLVNNLIVMIGGVALLISCIAASITIISCSFQRIIKPLVIMPFASITVAMGSGSGEASRVMTSYLKTFFGFCISGAFMVVCIKLGAQLSSHIVLGTTGNLRYDILVATVQTVAVPLVIAGLVKSVDSVIARFF